MKTAVIYARYSSDRQTEQSIEGQLRVCNEYAKRNDIIIVHNYTVSCRRTFSASIMLWRLSAAVTSLSSFRVFTLAL